MAQVNGHPHLHKNASGVIVNRSSSERRAYRQAKAQAMKQLESQDEIMVLRQELNELKDLIKQLAQNNGS